MLTGSSAATITSWSDASVCFTFEPGIEDGLLLVLRADRLRSNAVPFVAAGMVERFVIPAEVYPDTVLAAVGTNLGRSALTLVPNATVLERSPRQLLFRSEQGGTHPVEVKKRGRSLGGMMITVKPKVVQSCRAAATAPCTLLGVGFDDGTTTFSGAVTVDGAAATLLRWNASTIAFSWPAGLTPGAHVAQLTGMGGLTFTAQVELLPPTLDRLVLTDGVPLSHSLGYAHGRPTQTQHGLLAPLYHWAQGTSGPVVGTAFAAADVVDVQSARPDRPPHAVIGGAFFTEPAGVVHISDYQGKTYLLGRAQGNITNGRVIELTPPDGGTFVYWSARQVTDVGGPSPVHPAALGVVQGRLVTALASRGEPLTWVRELTPDGGGLLVGPATTLGQSFNVGSSDPASAGAYFSDDGVYLAPCHDMARTAEVHFAAAGLDGGALSFGALEPVITAPGQRLLTCNTTSAGLWWIQGDTTSERLMRHRADAGLEVLSTVPATLPGARQRSTFSAEVNTPGLLDLVPLPGGDVVVLVNEDVGPPRGLRLVRWHAATDSWTVGAEVVPPSTALMPGERCLGPYRSAAQCPALARDGCAPFACSVQGPDLQERSTTRISEGRMVVRGAEVRVLYETTETAKLPGAVFSGTEVHAVTLPLP